MQTLYTLAYPDVPAEPATFMEDFKRAHALPGHAFVAPHFTLVFGCAAVAQDVYTRHVAQVARESAPIRFACRYAMLGADDEGDTAYVFLVPDDGFAALSLLHDRLYAGPLEAFLRLDLPYIPHVTIAAMKDRRGAKALCDRLNAAGVRVEGWVRRLTVCSREDGHLRDASSHLLAA